MAGALSTSFSGVASFFQLDFKKIVAYSTGSQLGYLFFSSVIFNGDVYSFYHLYVHAFFKALLFLSSGFLIQCSGGEQDIRFMSGFSLYSSTFFCLFTACASMCGLPGFSGYLSKELILISLSSEPLLGYWSEYDLLFFSCCTFVAMHCIIFTFCYSFRLCFLVLASYNAFEFFNIVSTLKTTLSVSTFVLFFLEVFTVLSGFFFENWLVFLLDSHFEVSTFFSFASCYSTDITSFCNVAPIILGSGSAHSVFFYFLFVMEFIICESLVILCMFEGFFFLNFVGFISSRFYFFNLIFADHAFAYTLGFGLYQLVDKYLLEFGFFLCYFSDIFFFSVSSGSRIELLKIFIFSESFLLTFFFFFAHSICF